MTELIYGVRKTDGKIISINEIPDNMLGLSCNCICAKCGKDLQACSLHGMVRPYFRHNTAPKMGENNQCNSNIANETALHQLAKQIIAEECKILVPQRTVSLFEVGINNLPKETGDKIPKWVFREPMTVYAQYVELEKHLGKFTPDIFIKTDRGELLVEIFVSHRVNDDKKDKAREYGYAMLEIDLSSFAEKPLSSDELRNIILNSEKHKRWMHYPLSHEVLNIAKKYYEAKIKEHGIDTAGKIQNACNKTINKKRYDVKEDYHSSSLKERIGEVNYAFYLEVEPSFNDRKGEKIIDSRGKRWLECKCCGDRLLYEAFSKFNVDENVNLGVCTMCCHRNG